jgi:hypothetical protein
MMTIEEIALLPNIEQRFWSKVVKGNGNGCWGWSGNKARGYGLLSTKHGQTAVKAHRLSWYLRFGFLPENMNVCHACDNPECTNPEHLLIGTQQANMIDAKQKNRIARISYFGENNPAAMFSNEVVQKIRKEYTEGATREALSKKYKTKNIDRIIRNKVYVDDMYVPINGNARPRPFRKIVNEEYKRTILSSSKSAYQLAKELPFSKPTILKIRNGVY